MGRKNNNNNIGRGACGLHQAKTFGGVVPVPEAAAAGLEPGGLGGLFE
jgi:hypothetical protein